MIKLNTTMKTEDGLLWVVVSEDRGHGLVNDKWVKNAGPIRGYFCRQILKDGTQSKCKASIHPDALIPLN